MGELTDYFYSSHEYQDEGGGGGVAIFIWGHMKKQHSGNDTIAHH